MVTETEKQIEPDEIIATLKACKFAMEIIEQCDLHKVLRAYNRMETVAPLFSPTFYVQKRDNIEKNMELIRAALPLLELSKKWQHDEGEDE